MPTMAAPTIPRADDRSAPGGGLARRAKEALGFGLIVAALVLAVALYGHDANDPSLNRAAAGPSTNPLGYFGASLADFGYQVFGLASWLVVLILPFWGVRLIVGAPLAWPWLPVLTLPLALLATSAWLASPSFAIPDHWQYWVGLGGHVGDFLMHRLERPLGADTYWYGSAIAALVLSLTAIGVSGRELWDSARTLLARRGGAEPPPAPQRPRFDQAIEQRFGPARPAPPPRPALLTRLAAAGSGVGAFFTGLLARRRRDPGLAEPARAEFAAGPARRRRPPVAGARRPPEEPPPRVVEPEPVVEPAGEVLPDVRFTLPPLRFLAQPRARDKLVIDKTTLTETAQGLERVLDDFGVRGDIVDVRPGPVVTLYELEPSPGTRAARVISLADDIARSLCAMSVRVATVPGRNVIGIELPNDERETVFLRDLLASPAYEDTAARLALALGKDIGGEPVVVDLARMPHLLIAGTTGSGKSVAINAMILSLLYRLPPEQCKMIMIDPKVIELSVYDGIPHLLAPVVTEPYKAVVALKWVVREMDERYRVMSHLGVRDIFAYNRRIKEAVARGDQLQRRVQTGFEPGTGVPVFEQQPIEMTQMPLIVVIVDEVADLMLTAGKEIESAIQRLSQKARAAGIHLIVATQRPSVDVLTGVIKANLPSRISFRVSSKIDSRTILGEPGAEQLLGQGDMLFMMPGERILRIHGPLVTEEEVERVVSYLREQGEPDYVDAVTDEAALESGGGAIGAPFETAGNEDAQYQQAIQIVAKEGKVSTSFLQRKMRIGYNSAARLVERMEADGHISHPDHVGRRRVLLGGNQEE
jgi:DNA segregation ATPase FtsK/SpoIIIE, S-DNA-T family